MTQPALDRETILRAIETWPHEEQLALAREIERLVAAPSAPRQYASFMGALGLLATPGQSASRMNGADSSTWDALYGIASDGREPPTDEDVARWLEERHEGK